MKRKFILLFIFQLIFEFYLLVLIPCIRQKVQKKELKLNRKGEEWDKKDMSLQLVDFYLGVGSRIFYQNNTVII